MKPLSEEQLAAVEAAFRSVSIDLDGPSFCDLYRQKVMEKLLHPEPEFAARIETQRLYALNALADYEREMLGDDYPLLEGHEIGNK